MIHPQSMQNRGVYFRGMAAAFDGLSSEFVCGSSSQLTRQLFPRLPRYQHVRSTCLPCAAELASPDDAFSVHILQRATDEVAGNRASIDTCNISAPGYLE